MIRLATVFSGVGAVEQALVKNNIEHDIVFACDNGERYINIDDVEIENIKKLNKIDRNHVVNELYNSTNKPNYVKHSYFKNYNIEENRWFEDIRFIDGDEFNGKVDLFVGGSPCQSFSNIGKRGGLEDARGTLFYEYARLVKEISPKVFIYENVPGMLHHDKGKTWKVIKEILNSLDYKIYSKVLNSLDYGIPQDRKRLFVVGFKNKNVDFEFPDAVKLNKTVWDFLDEEPVATNHYLGRKGFEFVTNPKYKNRARVNRDILQTQKANQQFNWNGDFIFVPLNKIQKYPDIMNRAYVGEYNGQLGVCRQLTYRECFRMMGFGEDFVIEVPKRYAYRQSGNSIVVNVLEKIIEEILKAVNLNEKN